MTAVDNQYAPLSAAVNEILQAAGHFLDELVVRKAGRRLLVQVMIDSVERLDLDQIAALSREIDQRIENDNLLGEAAFTLEVSSRGVDRPLVLPRHFLANVGRILEFKTPDGQKRKLRLLSAADDKLVFENDLEFLVADVTPASVVLEFNRKDSEPISFDVTEELTDED